MGGIERGPRGSSFMPPNHCLHYRYICTLIKSAHNRANNAARVLCVGRGAISPGASVQLGLSENGWDVVETSD